MLSAVARPDVTFHLCRGSSAAKTERRLPDSTLLLPILGTLISLALFFTLNAFNFVAAAIALAVGAVIYLVSPPVAGATTT